MCESFRMPTPTSLRHLIPEACVRRARLLPAVFAVASLLGLLASPPAACAAAAAASGAAQPHIELPTGWTSEAPRGEGATQHALYSDHQTAFELTVRPKMDYAANVDLMAFAARAKKNTARASKLANRQETALTTREVAGHKTVEYEISGEFEGRRFRYRHIALQCGDNFCLLSCSTSPSRWDSAQAKFDELVARLK
jgi:hypothetical protein